ncbi:hypothetical protein ACQ4WX_29630 [Streptomyces lasalocidi]
MRTSAAPTAGHAATATHGQHPPRPPERRDAHGGRDGQRRRRRRPDREHRRPPPYVVAGPEPRRPGRRQDDVPGQGRDEQRDCHRAQ